ncbi:MAG: hypothetical protein VX672_09020, partial [Planctomycetota bacterium]|nr:hypothetical protein [Planctomycetota bacterium]
AVVPARTDRRSDRTLGHVHDAPSVRVVPPESEEGEHTPLDTVGLCVLVSGVEVRGGSGADFSLDVAVRRRRSEQDRVARDGRRDGGTWRDSGHRPS